MNSRAFHFHALTNQTIIYNKKLYEISLINLLQGLCFLYLGDTMKEIELVYIFSDHFINIDLRSVEGESYSIFEIYF